MGDAAARQRQAIKSRRVSQEQRQRAEHRFDRTLDAFLAEESTLWDIVDALVADIPGHCSATDLGECQKRLAAVGIERQAATIKGYRITGRFVEYATAEQAKVFRSQSVGTIRAFAERGASQEFALDAIRKYQKEARRRRMAEPEARALFSKPGPDSGPKHDPEDWTPIQWEAFDRHLVDASKIVLTGLNCWQRGIYTPSVQALAQLALLKPQDLDAELAALLD